MTNAANTEGQGSMLDWLKEYHAGHNCDPGSCECKCGCQVTMGCRNLSNLCSMCHVRWVRDDDDHGPKPDATWTDRR